MTDLPRLARILAEIRAAKPRASVVYAQIVLRLLERGPAYQADLCVDFGDDPNSSTVPQALQALERAGVVAVERGPRREGNTVRLAEP